MISFVNTGWEITIGLCVGRREGFERDSTGCNVNTVCVWAPRSVRAESEAALQAEAEGDGATEQPAAAEEGRTRNHGQETLSGCDR